MIGTCIFRLPQSSDLNIDIYNSFLILQAQQWIINVDYSCISDSTGTLLYANPGTLLYANLFSNP